MVGNADVTSDVHPRHLTAQSDDAELCMNALNQLESKDKMKRSAVLAWIRSVALELALSSHGCRVVQKAFTLANCEDQHALAIKLHGRVKELAESPHGNHVLQKCIEVLQPQSVQFIIDELACWPLSWVAVAKHRFGCRVMQRLLEHCPEGMTTPLIEAIVRDASELARHPYGNYVVQHVLEYGTPVHWSLLVVAFVESGIASLAQHRIASNVIERLLGHISSADQHNIALALLTPSQKLVEMSCHRYGTFVVHRFLEALSPGPLRSEVVKQLHANLPQIAASKHSKQLVEKLSSVLQSDQSLCLR